MPRKKSIETETQDETLKEFRMPRGFAIDEHEDGTFRLANLWRLGKPDFSELVFSSRESAEEFCSLNNLYVNH